MDADRDERPQVVHLTMDYPDAFRPHKTEAIRRLVDLTADEFNHRVLSMNRVRPGFGDLLRATAGQPMAPRSSSPLTHGSAHTYGAFGGGLLHARFLGSLGHWLADELATGRRGLPALIVGHKLTVEGVAVARAAALLGIPYALSIQGNTDTKILRVRPDLRPLMRRAWTGASAVFSFAPWSFVEVNRTLGVTPAPVLDLPCATDLDTPLLPSVGGGNPVTVFNLAGWREKNFDRLVEAHSLVRSRTELPKLHIVGGGEGGAADRARSIGRASGVVEFEGHLDRGAMAVRLNRAAVMVLPSRRETFGMAFVEALFAGCPIIYPAGRAIDGYFDGAPFALRVDPESPAEIANAIESALRDEAGMKAALADWQSSPAAQTFRRPAIAAQFARGLRQAIARGRLGDTALDGTPTRLRGFRPSGKGARL